MSRAPLNKALDFTVNAAEAILSGVSLALLGVFAVLLGIKCLGEYRNNLRHAPLYMMAWDIVVAALQTGTSWGYLAGTLFLVGGAFVVIGSVWAMLTVATIALR